MRMPALRSLHESMLAHGVEQQVFRFNLGAVAFEGCFCIRSTPFSLCLQTVGDDPVTLIFRIRPGYWIDEYFGDVFNNIQTAFGVSRDQVVPRQFLARLDAALPVKVTDTAAPKTAGGVENAMPAPLLRTLGAVRNAAPLHAVPLQVPA